MKIRIDMAPYRRNWFLERVLKLGLTPLAKEYQCVNDFT